MAQLPQHITNWLKDERGLSDETIEMFDLHYFDSGPWIGIPIKNEDGEILYYKKRRDPNDPGDKPKYSYSRGASASLFGVDHIEDEDTVVICEGEFDAMILWEHGIPAVSSTGGSSTFKSSWKKYLLDKEVFICYDRDEAGYKGAFEVQRILPDAKIIWLPEIDGVNDVTDYLNNMDEIPYTAFPIIMEEAKTYECREIQEPENITKKQRKKIIDEYKKRINKMMEESRELKSEWKSDDYCQVYIDYHLKLIEEQKRIINYKPRRSREGEPQFQNKIPEAKDVPISRFVEFNGSGFAPCIWHNENEPSMYYYEESNRVKCFGCGAHGDVIDVVQEQQKVGMKRALKIILSS